jgi:hypothetical protein
MSAYHPTRPIINPPSHRLHRVRLCVEAQVGGDRVNPRSHWLCRVYLFRVDALAPGWLVLVSLGATATLASMSRAPGKQECFLSAPLRRREYSDVGKNLGRCDGPDGKPMSVTSIVTHHRHIPILLLLLLFLRCVCMYVTV